MRPQLLRIVELFDWEQGTERILQPQNRLAVDRRGGMIHDRVVGHRVDRGVEQDGVPRDGLPGDGDFTDDAGHRTQGEVVGCHDAPRAELAQRLADNARKQHLHAAGDRPSEGLVGRHVLDSEGVPPRIKLEDLVNEVEHHSSIGGGLLRPLELTDHDPAKGLWGEEGGDEVDRHIWFETIHPFLDGNGRMARLLTLLLFYHSGYEVGRYISLEHLIENQREGYYDALFKSSQGWHEGRHSLVPWWEYFLGVMLLGAYQEFERRTGELTNAHGAKSEMVLSAIKKLPQQFQYADLTRACPNVSRPTIKRVLGKLRDEGEIECIKPGRDAVWEKRES